MFHPRHLRCKLFSRAVTIPAFILSAVIASLLFSTAAQNPPDSGIESITRQELREIVYHVASRQFKGRGNGTPELRAVADYIANAFRESGLKPAGAGETYYQSFEMYSPKLGPGNRLSVRRPNQSPRTFSVGTAFVPEQWSVSGTVSGPIVTALDSSSDVKGKIAVIVGDADAGYRYGRQMEEAGALALIVAQDPRQPHHWIRDLAEYFREDLSLRDVPMLAVADPAYPGIPVITAAPDFARDLPAGSTATLTVDVRRQSFTTANVVGLIEGTDPRLKDEVLVIGAHYDHDGENDGQIWPGADDNGSGIAALLELAEAIGKDQRPARSIMLAAFAGEEKGLVGSRHYVHHPIYPLDQTVGMLQMDMIGRNEHHGPDPAEDIPAEEASANANSLNVLGSIYSPDLRRVIEKSNEGAALQVRFRYDYGAEDLLRRSDQWSFLERGIPAVFFFAGMHPDYHTPRDTPEKLNYPKLEKIARLVYLTAVEVATREQRLKYTVPSPLPGRK